MPGHERLVRLLIVCSLHGHVPCKNEKARKAVEAFRAWTAKSARARVLAYAGTIRDDTARLSEACSPQQQHAQVGTANTMAAVILRGPIGKSSTTGSQHRGSKHGGFKARRFGRALDNAADPPAQSEADHATASLDRTDGCDADCRTLHRSRPGPSNASSTASGCSPSRMASRVELFSRNRLPLLDAYRPVADAIAALPIEDGHPRRRSDRRVGPAGSRRLSRVRSCCG